MFRRKIEEELKACLILDEIQDCPRARGALKFGDYNVGRNGALLTLPFYMWYLLW